MNRFLAAILLLLVAPVALAQDVVRVGAKNFTEQEILGEIAAQLIERNTDLRVERRFGLAGTDVCHAALRSGQIDLYVEYTGTALLNVLKRPVISNPARAYRAVATAYDDRFELEWLPPIGFNNTYAITVREADAEANGWTTISDLPDTLRAGFTSEFVERPDGLAGLRDAYDLSFASVSDLDPGLMYDAVANGQVDVICAFATDGRISAYDLRVLDDDRSFFPPYDAAFVVRADTLARHPHLRIALAPLAGGISDDAMRDLNHRVDVLGQDPADVARAWIARTYGSGAPTDASEEAPPERKGWLALAYERRSELLQKTTEHLVLTAIGAGIAVVIGVPLGIITHRFARARGPVLALTEIVQTIPSLAMLAFLFAVYGLLGTVPAVTALVLYALLPIVLNTYTGLRGVPDQVVEAADAVGMTGRQKLVMVELPLASRVVVAGIRAAAILTVGIATLSTYIGAGGLGDFIARGLARNDPRLTLLGAVPAAIMAVALGVAFRLIERALPRA